MSRITIMAIGLLTLVGCGGGGGGGSVGTGGTSSNGTSPSNTFTLSSTSFSSGASIPTSFRCTNSGGAGNLPQLNWSNLPAGTKSLVIIMDDEDAALVQGSTYTHYFALIPREAQLSTITSINSVSSPTLPYENSTSTAGSNWIVLSDLPPCNPTSTPHTYRWTAYALNTDYNSITAMKTEFDAVINNALNTSGLTENLNYTIINGTTLTPQPRFTRVSFEAAYGQFIADKATFTGRM